MLPVQMRISDFLWVLYYPGADSCRRWPTLPTGYRLYGGEFLRSPARNNGNLEHVKESFYSRFGPKRSFQIRKGYLKADTGLIFLKFSEINSQRLVCLE